MATPLSIRDMLHQYIDIADKQKLQAIYTLLEDEINCSYTEEEIKMLHKRRENHLNGTSKSYSAEEALRIVRQKKK